MIAIGRLPADNREVASVLVDANGNPAVLVETVWAWDGTEKCYLHVTTLDPLRSYWVFAPTEKTISIHLP